MKPLKLVWLIDDNEIDQRQYERVLKRSGLVEEVMTFTFADEALAHLRANPDLQINLIFLDINMPRMNGFEFLEAATKDLGKDFAEFVVAMLTTSLNPTDRERTQQFQAVKAFITKPLTISTVEEVVRQVAEQGAAGPSPQ